MFTTVGEVRQFLAHFEDWDQIQLNVLDHPADLETDPDYRIEEGVIQSQGPRCVLNIGYA